MTLSITISSSSILVNRCGKIAAGRVRLDKSLQEPCRLIEQCFVLGEAVIADKIAGGKKIGVSLEL